MTDGVWMNVIKAVNRGKSIECSLCGQVGATIGCAEEGCSKSYHFSCAENTAWRFDEEGKDFECDEHRASIRQTRKISLEYWMLKNETGASLECALCGETSNRDVGELVAFQEGESRVLVHDCCARHTNIGGMSERSSSRFENDFDNVFQAVDASRSCTRCAFVFLRSTGNHTNFLLSTCSAIFTDASRRELRLNAAYHRAGTVFIIIAPVCWIGTFRKTRSTVV